MSIHHEFSSVEILRILVVRTFVMFEYAIQPFFDVIATVYDCCNYLNFLTFEVNKSLWVTGVWETRKFSTHEMILNHILVSLVMETEMDIRVRYSFRIVQELFFIGI